MHVSRFSLELLQPQGVQAAISTALSRTLLVHETTVQYNLSLLQRATIFIRADTCLSVRKQVLVIYRGSLYR